MHDLSRYFCTLTALLCRSLSWFPVWVLLLMLSQTGSPLAGFFILAGLTFLSCFCIRTVLLRLRRNRTAANAVSVLLLLAFAALGIFLLYLLGYGIAVPVLLTAVTLSVCAYRCDEEPEKLFGVPLFAFCLTGTVIVPFLLYTAKLPVPVDLFLLTAGTVAALFGYLRNQTMLYRFVNRRSNTEETVPADIRRRNLLLVCGTVLAAACIFFLREPLIALLRATGHAFLMLVKLIVTGISKLIAFFAGNRPEGAAEEAGEIQQSQQAAKGDSLWNLLLLPLIAVAVYFWKIFVSDWIFTLRDAILAIADRLRNGPAGVGDSRRAAEDYTDTETAARPEEPARRRLRKWRKRVRAWRLQPDSREKFYAGYQLLLCSPAWGRLTPKDAETVREICGKWEHNLEPADLLHAVTEDFHADSYAQTGLPAQAIRDLESALSCLLKGYINDL